MGIYYINGKNIVKSFNLTSINYKGLTDEELYIRSMDITLDNVYSSEEINLFHELVNRDFFGLKLYVRYLSNNDFKTSNNNIDYLLSLIHCENVNMLTREKIQLNNIPIPSTDYVDFSLGNSDTILIKHLSLANIITSIQRAAEDIKRCVRLIPMFENKEMFNSVTGLYITDNTIIRKTVNKIKLESDNIRKNELIIQRIHSN